MGLVEREARGAVAVLALNRPERKNALSGALVEALSTALDEVDRDRDVRAVVITGRGTAFCSGGDLADGMASTDEGFLGGHRGRGRFVDLLERIPRARAPVIAAVHGDAMGGGLGLVAACDLVVCDPGARLATPEIKLGLFPWIILAVLQKNVPRKALFEMAVTGEKLSADRARELGLVNRVSAPGAALEDAIALGNAIAERSPAIVELGKAAFHRVSDMDTDDALRYLHSQLTLNLLTEDAAEGVSAFLGRRPPQWKGR